jgi:hypothetical protein
MPKKEKTGSLVPLTINSNTELAKSLNISLTKDDIIAYRVSQEEERLEQLAKDLEMKLAKLRQSVRDETQLLQKAAGSQAEVVYGPKVTIINEAFRALGVNTKYQLEVSSGPLRRDKDTNGLVFGVIFANEKYSHDTTQLEELAYTAAMRTMQVNIEIQEKQVMNTAEELSAVRTILANMNRLERKARAEFTKRVLSENVELSQLLSQNNA